MQYKLTLSDEKLQKYENDNRQLEKSYSGIQQFASTSFQERLYDSNIFDSKVVESGNNEFEKNDSSDIQQFVSASFQERFYDHNIDESKITESDNNASLLGKNKNLMSLSKPNQSKKRRLFDPKRLDYLKDLEQNN